MFSVSSAMLWNRLNFWDPFFSQCYLLNLNMVLAFLGIIQWPSKVSLLESKGLFILHSVHIRSRRGTITAFNLYLQAKHS